MKNRSIFLSLILLVLCTALRSHYSADALSFGGSYSNRVYGSEANYWNPANLSFKLASRGELILVSSYFDVGNNAFSISRYNSINGSYLTERDKLRIVDDLNGSLFLRANLAHSLFGLAIDNMAFSSKINVFSSAKMSDRYIELLLFGNEYEELYKFGSRDNGFNLLTYGDITFGFSPYSFNIMGYQIHAGFAVSLLYGIAVFSTDSYESELYISDDGIKLDQEIIVKAGIGGTGFKSLLGFRSDINEQLSLSFTLDNLPGFITWTGETEKIYYVASVDSVYIASLSDKIIEHSDTSYDINPFTTVFPVVLTTSAMYRFDKYNFSVDWKQSFKNSVLTEKKPVISMAGEFQPIKFLSLRLGFEPSFGGKPYAVSYGSALLTNSFDLSFGIRSYSAVFPSSYSKGIAVALTSKWRF